MKAKICPKCGMEYSADINQCSVDGTTLEYKPMTNACQTCGRQYSKEFEYCPVHGVKLTTYVPGHERTAEESRFENEPLGEEEKESFPRSPCPACKAWNNWSITGEEYTCQSCMKKYTYRKGELFESFSDKSDFQVKAERREGSPDVTILKAIDAGNKDYWMEEFGKYKTNIAYKKWNWPSFFFGISRYFWKGMWKKGLLIYGIFIAAGIFSVLFSRIMMSASAPSAAQNFFSGWISLSFIGIKIYLGSVGGRDYYKFVSNFNDDIVGAKSHLRIGRILFFITLAVNTFLPVSRV